MGRKIILGILFLVNIQAYTQQKKNILLLCIDDLRPELKSFGANYIISPNIDALTKKGRAFYNHYVNAPSCGPSRYTLLTGVYGPANNQALFKRAQKIKEQNKKVKPSMPEWFKLHGYTTVSLGKVSHHPGGLGGDNWNDSNAVEMPNTWDESLMPVSKWQHPKGAMHGLAHGEIRKKANQMVVFQSEKGEDTIYPDGHIANKALQQLETFSKTEKPFFFAVGFIKPHLPFGAPKKYYDMYDGVNIPKIHFPIKPNWNSTWHRSGEFMKYKRWNKNPNTNKAFAKEVKRHYAACVTYVDTQVGKVLKKLKETGLDKNTVIVLWGDHGWSLGEHGIWGKHSLFKEALHSPLIIVDKSIRKKGEGTNAVVETVDLFPTLCDLTKIPTPNFVDGVSLQPILKNPNAKGHEAYSYKGGAKSIKTINYRLTVKQGEPVELFNHKKDPYETENIINKHPEVVSELLELMKLKRFKNK